MILLSRLALKMLSVQSLSGLLNGLAAMADASDGLQSTDGLIAMGCDMVKMESRIIKGAVVGWDACEGAEPINVCALVALLTRYDGAIGSRDLYS